MEMAQGGFRDAGTESSPKNVRHFGRRIRVLTVTVGEVRAIIGRETDDQPL
ncbi:hypothetical protein ACFOW4_19660 [Micromonospora sp. GCM10011542]|uniref:hypothetical protein n=1 Tax=Micromonospora sp. GCM10011542 TaxID=3317337 RepID=UPI003613FB44